MTRPAHPSATACTFIGPLTASAEVHRSRRQLITDEGGRTRPSWFHFTRHLVEMFLAMMAGMMVGAFLLATAVGTSVAEARRNTQLPGSS